MTTGTKFAISAFIIVIIGAAAVVSIGNVQLKGLAQPAGQVARPNTAAGILAQNTSSTAVTETPSSLPVLSDSMPGFVGITRWYNTPNGQPLTPESLLGKVVLVDFWTYSCINCIRTYPFLKSMYEKYADKGLVIVGVHTPEFAFEADPNNVANAIQQNGILYPVALDAHYETWSAYQNEYWPAEYLFDREGRLRLEHFGEGEYDQSEEAIRGLLNESPGEDLSPMGTAVTMPDLSKIETPETYFGLARESNFADTPGAEDTDVDFSGTSNPGADDWSISGTWKFEQEYVQADSEGATFDFSVRADKLHLVLDSVDGKDKVVDIYIDGRLTTTAMINAPMLYTVAEFPDAKRHTVEIRIEDPGVRFYSATFS